MTSLRTSPDQRHHGIVKPGPGLARFLYAHAEHVGVTPHGRKQLRGSVSGLNPASMLMEPAAQLYDFGCPIYRGHGGEVRTC